jgi:hypothetical protein
MQPAPGQPAFPLIEALVTAHLRDYGNQIAAMFVGSTLVALGWLVFV